MIVKRLACALATAGVLCGLFNAAALAQSPASCSNTAPPPAVDTSEVPKPGEAVPPPLPVPAPPIGGEALASCGVLTAPGVGTPPAEVTAGTWVVADVDSGEILAARDPHGRQRPASTIKVLTGLLAVQELNMDDTIVATQADADQEGSKVGLLPGTPYQVRQVLTGLMLQSGNDAAHALAVKMGGVQTTVAKMNKLAAQLGARDTRAATPSGLDGPGMSTSAYDLALIVQAGMKHPEFAAAWSARQSQLPNHPGQPPVTLFHDNDVVLEYPGALGGKTGFTDDARHTFIAAAERNGRRLVTVLLRGENRPTPLSDQAMSLLDYGFSNPTATRGIGKLTTPAPAAPEPRRAHATQQSEASGSAHEPSQAHLSQDERGTTETSARWLVLAVALAAIAIAIPLYRRHRRFRRR